MADEENPGQDYEANGTTYRIPKLTDTADAVVAFTDYSNSIPFSEYIQTEDVSGAVTVDDSYNGKMIVAKGDTVLTFGNLTNGFSVACVADGDHIISYEGVDKEKQQTQAYEVATVVTVNTIDPLTGDPVYRNILSVARAQSDNIIIDQGPAEGTPPAPVITNPDGGSVISFTPGTPDANQAPAIFYSAKIRRQDNADLTTETATVDQDNMEIDVAGTEPFVYYVVDVYGINEEGKGETAKTNAFQLNYNQASGGDEAIVDYYKGTNEKWKVHTFTFGGDTTLTIDSAPNTFHVLVAGGGGDSGTTSSQGWSSGGGGGGAVYENESADLSGQATYSVTVGTNGNPGGASILETFPQQNGGARGSNSTNTTAAGGASGNGNAGAPTGNNGAGGGTIGNYSVTPNGLTSSITGSEVLYGAGRADGIARLPNTGCGAGGSGGANRPSNPGQKGVVIVAYQIGTSTTRQIEQAQAEADARQAGVEQGIEQGYSQAQEELTSLRTQLSAVGTSDV